MYTMYTHICVVGKVTTTLKKASPQKKIWIPRNLSVCKVNLNYAYDV